MKRHLAVNKTYLMAALLGALLSGSTTPSWGDAKSTTSGDPVKAPECAIKCVQPYEAPEPHSPKPEAPDVISVLEELSAAYSRGDLATYEKLLDPEITAMNDESGRLMKGKAAVLASLKDAFALHAAGGAEPLLSLTIDEPYVKVTGDMAVVTYKAIEQIGGQHPAKREKLSTAIFVKDGDAWRLVHNRVQSVVVSPKGKGH